MTVAAWKNRHTKTKHKPWGKTAPSPLPTPCATLPAPTSPLPAKTHPWSKNKPANPNVLPQYQRRVPTNTILAALPSGGVRWSLVDPTSGATYAYGKAPSRAEAANRAKTARDLLRAQYGQNSTART